MRTERLIRAAAVILFAVVLVSTVQAGKWQEYAICGVKETGAEGDQELAGGGPKREVNGNHAFGEPRV